MTLFRNNKGKVAGFLKNGVYYKTVNSKKHFMRIYNAYGIDTRIVDELIALKCEKIRLKEEDTKKIYEVLMSNFCDYSFEKGFGGHDLQTFLPIKYWKLEDATMKLF